MTQLRGIPRWFVLPALLAMLTLFLPLAGMVGRIPYSELGTILTSDSALDALWLSLRTCVVSTIVCMLIGTPLALIFARAGERPKRPWWLTPTKAFVLVPLVMPPVVAGLALLITFGRTGLIGGVLADAFGFTIPFTTLAVVMAQVFVSLPFLVMTVETAAKAAGSDLEHAAASLGASTWVQFSRVSLPLLGPSLASGAALSFARSLGEFGATITFAGSMEGTTRTLPLEVYLQREQDTDTALALSLVLIVFALALTAFTTVLESRNMRRFQQPEGADPEADEVGEPATVSKPAGSSTAGASSHAEPATSSSARHTPTPGWSVHADVPERGVDVTLEGQPGSVTALIGPNGAGKSTVLRLLAGDLTSPQSTVNTSGPIGFLDQSPALFPHMSALENVAFGPRCHGVGKDQAYERARAELAAVGLSHIASKAPWQLSGGQQQRVALARMLAVDPQLLLLDEPFAALDQTSASALRSIIRERLSGGLTAVVVTHDLLDAVSLASEVAVLEAGSLVAQGPSIDILTNPPNAFVARFAGTNMFAGRFHDGTVVLNSGLAISGQNAEGLAEGEPAAAVFAPTAVAVRRDMAPGSPRNLLRGTVTSIDAGRTGIDVSINIGADHPLIATVTAESIAQMDIAPGQELIAEIKAVQVRIISMKH